MRNGSTARLAATLVAAVTFAGAVHAPAGAAPRKRKGKADAAHVVSIDLSSLPIDGSPTLTLSLPETLWRAHLPRMLKYPRKNQLNGSAGKRVASRWLEATVADGRSFNAQIFVIVEPAQSGTVRQWARRIANWPDDMYPFEDARFDGPWIVNQETFKLAGKKRIKGYQLENSGGRVGEDYRSVWQFAALPMPDDFNLLLGVKRRAPTTWAPGKGGPPDGGSVGIGGGLGLGGSGDGTGSMPDTGGAGDGSLGDGIGDSGDMGDINTEPDSDQVRASSELFRRLIAGVHLAQTSKMRRGLRRFQLRDEWDSAKGLTSRFVGISVPARWRSTPTTALKADRIEWTERGPDGAVTAIARVELIGANPTQPIAQYAKQRFADWDITDFELSEVRTRDGTSTAAICETPLAAPQGLRRGDDRSWVREIGYVMADSTFYEIEIVRPADAVSRQDELRAMLESIEISVAY
jgi:hypothetical protein